MDEKQREKKPLIPCFAQKRDVFLCLFIALAAASALLFMHCRDSGGTPVAVITVDGGEYMTVSLTQENAGIIHIPTQPPVTLEVSEGGIRFTDAQCRDRLCEKCGLLTAGDTAACLPAKCAVTVKAAGSGSPDGLSY